MTVDELRRALEGLPGNAPVAFMSNDISAKFVDRVWMSRAGLVNMCQADNPITDQIKPPS